MKFNCKELKMHRITIIASNLAILLISSNLVTAGIILPEQELWGVLTSADAGGLSETTGGAEVPSSVALPGNVAAESAAELTSGLGLPELKIFAYGASGENSQAEGVQKYRYDGLEAGDVVINASFSATVEFAAQFEGLVALITEDGFVFNTEAEIAQLFNDGQFRFNLDETISAEDQNSGTSSSTGSIDLGIEANLEPGTVFWVYAFFGGTAFEGEVDGFSTGTLNFADPSNVTLLGQSVPEPATLALLTLTSMTILIRRRRT